MQADWILHFQRPPRDWPQNGNVRFNNYSVRYREGLDLVLKGITCEIVGGERVCILFIVLTLKAPIMTAADDKF